MSAVPAVLVCDPGTCDLPIAGLSVLDRMVVAAHRAGCAPITIVAEQEPRLARAAELGIEVSTERTVAAARRQLLIEGSVLVEARDVERVVAENGQLISADGSPLPVAMSGSDANPIVAEGIAIAVTDAVSARLAEQQLWTSLGSSADGVVDRYFNRPVGRRFSKLLVHKPISPNQVSIVSILIGVAAAPFFVRANFLVGALLLQLSAIIDCVDGDLARVLFKQSRLGKWLDLLGDQVVHVSVFAAIGLGVARIDPATPALLLGASAAVGVLLSLPPLIRALRQPATQRSPLLSRLIEAAANRDFSILLLILALVGRMDVFLWLAGIGVHVFWIALWSLQQGGRGDAAMSRKAA